MECAQAAKQAPHDSIAFCLTPLASGLCCHALRLETFERDNFEGVDRISELQQLQDTPTCVHAKARGSVISLSKLSKCGSGMACTLFIFTLRLHDIHTKSQTKPHQQYNKRESSGAPSWPARNWVLQGTACQPNTGRSALVWKSMVINHYAMDCCTLWIPEVELVSPNLPAVFMDHVCK